MVFRLFILSTLSMLLLYCAGPSNLQQPQQRGDTVSRKQQKKLDESFDPASLDDYEKEWAGKKTPDIETVNVEQLLKAGSTTEALNESQKVSGYRVQLIATRDEKEAHAVMREAILKFEYRVYRTFDDPYYKVRVGDFVSRMKADQVREQAIQNDFLEAWVVRERVWRGDPPETTGTEADTTSM